MDEGKRKRQAHIIALLLTAAVVIFGVAYAVGRYAGHEAAQEKPTFMMQVQTQDAAALRAQLDISKSNADALQKRLAEAQAGQRAPTTTYYVSAPTVERAAQVVERQIREDDPTLPRAAREKTDRTVVTPITKDKDGKQLPTEEQKVDVYKINLNKAHKIKAGASVIDGKALMSVGYEQGRFEALAHFDGGRYKGVTVMYNVAEW
ncbi:glycoprotease [uncultured Selenomonas sp.]|uniref:glycoprotease n=1 Tax=uncultured Selenomonas sp. TaxID=159275 RepID=UPI0028DB64BB|nr:glycoprotease [uncultured Selenomonas sp.]